SRYVERSPSALVGEIRVGAPVEQERCELIVAVVHRREQRRPSVLGRFVDWRTGVNQQSGGLDVAFARRKHERGQSTTAAANQARDHDLVVIVVVGLGLLRSGCWLPICATATLARVARLSCCRLARRRRSCARSTLT